LYAFPIVDSHYGLEQWSDPAIPAQNVIDWFDSSSGTTCCGELLASLPTDLLELFNPALVNLYRSARAEGVLDACRDGRFVDDSTAPLCEAILDSELWSVLANDISFPTSLCHSPTDDVVGFVNIPDPATLPTNVGFYSPSLAILSAQGNHQAAYILCALDPITALVATPGDATSSPIYIEPIKFPPAQCLASACAGKLGRCDDSTPCCSGYTCKLRVIGQPQAVCSPNYIRSSLSGARGGAGGTVNGGD
jgi:hypothetical protein